MDKDNVSDLARKFTAKSKQAIQEAKITQRLTSPAVITVAMTIMAVMAEGEIDKFLGWSKT